MSQFKNKLVAVMNEKVEPGKAMNALAHMCIGSRAKIGIENLRLTNYIDINGNSHPNISEMPFMILKANSNKIRKLREEALANEIFFTDFTDTMSNGTFEEQIKRHSETKDEDLVYFGIIMFGDWNKVSEMTRKFSLWK